MSVPEPIRWQNGELTLLDQRRLPDALEWLRVDNIETAFHAIADMVVRGAPAIGIAAAYALAEAGTTQARKRVASDNANDFVTAMHAAGARLKSARPTAVNLAWAVNRLLAAMLAEMARAADAELNGGVITSAALASALRDEAEAIHAEDRAICRGIAEVGVALITPDCGVLTHCNAGALAVSELGTATAPMYLAHQRGTAFRVYADETRPVLQGARLTAWELGAAGIDVTLICDNMAAQLMSEGKVDLVIVGTDRVTANGDVVNKIGTLGVAILANHFGIPFYVACPSSTYDPDTARGSDVVIEERNPNEVTQVQGVRIAPADVKVRNPAFDVTPAELVTGIITERGLVLPPLAVNLAALLSTH